MAALANLGIVANVIAVLQLTVSNIGVCSEYVAGVKNAPRDRDRITTELEGLYVVLTQVFQLANGRASRLSALNERLHVCGDEMKRLRTALGDESENFEMGDLEARPDGKIEAALGREMAGLAKDLGRKGGVQALTWPLKEAEVEKTVDSIRKIKDSLIMAMEVDQIHLTLKIDSGIEVLQEQGAKLSQSAEDMKSGVQSLQRQAAENSQAMEHTKLVSQSTQDMVQSLQGQTAKNSQAMEQAKLQEHRRKIYDWLAAPDHESKHRNACSMRHETTGLWFLEDERFKEWREAPHSFLWLHGIPGAGKTILCSTIIEEISIHCSSDPSLAIAFFYFDFTNKDTSPNAVLRSLIEQLSVQSTSIPPALESLFSKNEQNGARRDPGQEELMSTLKMIIRNFQAIYIIFDALDECWERSRFLKVLGEVHDWKLDTLHLLATSRKEGDIHKVFGGLVSHEVPMDECLIGGDIQVYVSRRLVEGVEFRMCSAGEKEMVMTTLMQGAQGMFRWVVCQLDALQKCKTPVSLKKALSRLPKTLNETYDRILAAIDEDDKQGALSLLKWLAFSFDTLSLDQAVDVIATDPDAIDEPLFDLGRRLWDPQDILTICSSLVTITFPKDSSNKGNINHHDDNVLSTEAREIRLAHFSVREYLISEHLRTSMTTLSCYYFNEKVAHIFIAKTCLAYLLQFDQDNGVNWNTARSYPLSRYAAYKWMAHAGWDLAGDQDDLHELIMTLLEPTSTVYINWIWLYHQRGKWANSGANPLYITAEAGLERACQCLVQKGWGVNAPGGYYGTPLQAAASQGHDGIVRLLLDKGADMNMYGGHHRSALEVAASEGHSTTVQLLLEKGADMNGQGAYYGSVLEAAASWGHDSIVRLLIEKGVDMNAHGGGRRSALQAAVTWGHDTIVRLLIEKGVDVNAHGGRYGSALQVAAVEGQDMIVKVLLEKGADVNAHGGCHGSALQAAAIEGHDKIVLLLLENGADINAQGGEYGSALNAAASQGYDMIIQLLLEKGVDLNAHGACYGSALQMAVSGGHEQTVQLLIENGADVNAQGGYYGSALNVAAVQGRDMIIRLLLEKGADVNAQGGEFGNALNVAVTWGHEQIVQLLLEKGADVNVHGGRYRSALEVAASRGHDMIVRLLIEKGADVNMHQGGHRSALEAAASKGHGTTVQLLLEKGADVNPHRGCRSVLQVVASHGHESIVRLLLEKGADVNALGGEYGSALNAAASLGHDMIIQLLLEKGADVNAQAGHYGSALQVAATEGFEPIVQLLLEKGADVNAKGGYYGSALNAAADWGHDMIIRLLLEKGVDVNAHGGCYGSALQVAVSRGHESTVKLLIENGADVNAQGGYYGSALEVTSIEGRDTTVLLLLEKGANVKAHQGSHRSALNAAASRGHESIVRLLLEKGADVNAQGAHYGSALQVAASSGHATIVRLLLEKGADVNAQGAHYGSALQAAASQGHDIIVQLLLEMGASINTQGGVYGGALQAAVANGHDVIASLLLETAGAVPNVNLHTVLPELKLGSGWAATFRKHVPQCPVDVDLIHTLKHDDQSHIWSVHFSADGCYLAIGCKLSVQIYDTVTWERTCVLIEDNNLADLSINSVCFSPDGRYLATGTSNVNIPIWDLANKCIVSLLQGHNGGVTSLNFSHDGRLIVSGSWDNTMCIWDMENGQHKMLSITVPVNLSTGILSVSISPDGSLVAAGYCDNIVRLWDVQTGQLIECLMGHTEWVSSVMFTPNGKGLISGGLEGRLKYWDLEPWLSTQRGALGQSYEVGVENVGLSAEKSTQNEGVCVCTVEFISHTRHAVTSIAVSPDSQWVVSGSFDQSVRFWDLCTGEEQLILHGHRHGVLSVDLSQTGGMLATSGMDGHVNLWSYTMPQ